jgi:predicted nuclease of predicted toxin-antitoxin system
MKVLANAHISRLIFEFLCEQGHDCVHAEYVRAAMPDDELLRLSVDERRVLLTADKDFGELIFRRMMPAVGVILLRFRVPTEADRFALFRKHWPAIARCVEGHFVVVTNRRVRRTPLPATRTV